MSVAERGRIRRGGEGRTEIGGVSLPPSPRVPCLLPLFRSIFFFVLSLSLSLSFFSSLFLFFLLQPCQPRDRYRSATEVSLSPPPLLCFIRAYYPSLPPFPVIVPPLFYSRPPTRPPFPFPSTPKQLKILESSD